MSVSKKWFAFMAAVLFCAQNALADVVAAWNFNALVDPVPSMFTVRFSVRSSNLRLR